MWETVNELRDHGVSDADIIRLLLNFIESKSLANKASDFLENEAFGGERPSPPVELNDVDEDLDAFGDEPLEADEHSDH